MLVLSRRRGETLVLGNNVRVRVLDVRSGQVRIGIEAPAGVSIYREEIYEEIALANRRASEAMPDDLKRLALRLPDGRKPDTGDTETGTEREDPDTDG